MITDTSVDPAGKSMEPGSVAARRRIKYIPELDGLRGLAAVFVVSVHLFMIVIPDSGEMPDEIPGTFVFMDLFFVLSGFLITALLVKEQTNTGRIGLPGFYLRRGARLLPALWVMLIVHSIYAWTQGPPHYPADIQRESVILAALYGLNFSMDTMLAPVARGLTQLWSLGVEEQFYVVWPIVVILVLPVTRKLSITVTILTALILAVMTWRFWLWDDSLVETTGWLRLYTHTDTRADSLLVGALTAYLWIHRTLPSRRFIEIAAWISIPVFAWFLLCVELSSPFPYKGGFTLMAIVWAFVIIACVETNWSFRPVLRNKLLCSLGEVSYGIYLWHVPIQFAVHEHGADWSVTMRIVVSLVLTAIFVVASWHLVEKPFLRLKDRFDRRPAKQQQTLDTPANPKSTIS
jgi:peptidoglycan/LPS O-acetylase OafA/YrhL